MIHLTINKTEKTVSIAGIGFKDVFEYTSWYIPDRDNFIDLIVLEDKKEKQIKLPVHNTIVIIKE